MLAASDGYSYLHLVIVAGIITFAAGVKLLVRAPGAALADPVRLALCGGVAAYLLGHVAFRLRIVGTLGSAKVVVAIALLLLYALGGGLSAWSLTAAITVLLAALCVAETAVGVGAGRQGQARRRRSAPG